MKILQINSVCGIGSTGRIATDLHAAYEAEGYDSYIAYGRDQPLNCDKNKTIKIGNKTGNYKHVLKTRILDQHGFGSKKATIEFIEKVRGIDPDVLHLHNIHGYYLNVEILFNYIKEANKPVVWTLHDCWPFTGHCAYFDYAGCECWKPDGNHHCIQKESYPASWLLNNSEYNYARKKEAFTRVNNMTIVTPSKWLANLVEKSFLKEYPISVINNGVDLNLFKPTENDFRTKNELVDKYIILGVASVWDERKGYKYFEQLSSLISPEDKIVLVGLDDSQIKRLPSNIIGISRTNSVLELAEIYSAADVFVNPTLEDNFPTTNIEALACGTPVVTFDTGGSPEAIDKRTGLITKHKTAVSILAALNSLKENPISREACRERGELFSKEQMLKEYEQLI